MGKIIGLVCNSKLNQELVNNDQYLFSNNYIKRLRAQGGIPIGLLPVEGRLEEDVLEMCDAILICGGTNFTPAHLQAAHHAITNGKPLMGICLGCQTIHRYFNIMDAMAEEGVQEDIWSYYRKMKDAGDPRVVLAKVEGHGKDVYRDKEDEAKHEVFLTPGSRIAELNGGDKLNACTCHKYAAQHVSPRLTVSGRTEDGTVEVLEYGGDYSTAVAQGRREAENDPYSYFVDDENSPELFLGYAVAAFRLRDQLRLRGISPTPEQPLFVYLPCGVGGAPGGICFGLKMLFGKAVHCFFAEPVQSPCMTLGLVSGKHDGISVYDINLTNRTLADGLAVERPSAFVGKIVRNLVSGCFTVRDESLVEYQRLVRVTEGLKIEPSAAAGFAGPGMVLASDHLREQGLTPDRVLHLLWTTGGRYLPE